MQNLAEETPLALLTIEDAVKSYYFPHPKRVTEAFAWSSFQYLSELCLVAPWEIKNIPYIGPKTFAGIIELLNVVNLPPIGTFDRVIGNQREDKRKRLIEGSVDIFESIKAGVAKPVDTPFIAAQVNVARRAFRKAAMPDGDHRLIETNYLHDVRIAAARAELHMPADRLALA